MFIWQLSKFFSPVKIDSIIFVLFFDTGVPADYIEQGRNAKVVTEISKNGDVITIARKRPKRSSSNSFKLGEETEIDTIKGEKAKVSKKAKWLVIISRLGC